MKKILLSILTMATLGVNAQLPGGSQFEFEFTGGSLTNTSASGANNFVGNATAVTDRFGSTSNAIDPTGVLSGPATGTPNILESTLCFWMKHSSQTSGERILQMYGAGGNGYRVEYDQANKLYVNLQIDNPLNTQTPGGGFSRVDNVVIDDNNWHHIAIRTSTYGANGIEIEVFVDNVLQTIAVNPTFDIGVPITEFINNANFVVSPINNYTGDIDDIFFYKSALTNAEIGQIYNYSTAPPCTVNIPDANFKAYLVGRVSLNTNSDTEIQCSEAAAFSGLINCSSLSISDLTGIEAFTALQMLYCYSNSLNSLDVSNNTALTELICNGNSLTSLDVSANTALTVLKCNSTQITSLDVSANTALTLLGCINNSLINLDISQNTNLTTLGCDDNSLTNLNVSQNISLTYLSCSNNSLASLDVSQNTNLTQLQCNSNSLISLNVSQNINLISLNCQNNSLTSLNVANSNNANFISNPLAVGFTQLLTQTLHAYK